MPRSRVRFDDEFLRIFVFLGCFEDPVWRPFGTNRCEKTRPEQIMQKVLKKGSTRLSGKSEVRAVGP